MWTGVALLCLAVWLYLGCAHGGFWRAHERLRGDEPEPAAWPEVAAVVPARDEAACIGEAVASLVAQDYPGTLHVVVVDDESTDGTAAAARAAAAGHQRLVVIATPPRPPGWVGKMWAVHNGVEHVQRAFPTTTLLWLTDADIAHPNDGLRQLVALLEARSLDLASLMVRLDDRTGSEALLIPAFVYFFQLLYPFARVADPRSHTAAAAGGCILVRRAALARAGGIESIRGEIIDDCALARAVKAGGPIWIGLTERTRSIRGYGGLAGVWSMVARTAFTQLRYSWLLLGLTLAGLALVFVAPPLVVLALPLHGDAVAAAAAGAAWLLLAVSFGPTLALYGRPRWWGIALPLAALLYVAMTLDSSRRHARGRGAAWKGRFQADVG